MCCFIVGLDEVSNTGQHARIAVGDKMLLEERCSPYDRFVEEQDRYGIILLSGGFRTGFFKMRNSEKEVEE